VDNLLENGHYEDRGRERERDGGTILRRVLRKWVVSLG
jgi:hypothetical protein